jgi:hypothetical protein
MWAWLTSIITRRAVLIICTKKIVIVISTIDVSNQAWRPLTMESLAR